MGFSSVLFRRNEKGYVDSSECFVESNDRIAVCTSCSAYRKSVCLEKCYYDAWKSAYNTFFKHRISVIYAPDVSYVCHLKLLPFIAFNTTKTVKLIALVHLDLDRKIRGRELKYQKGETLTNWIFFRYFKS